jgi:GH24 family phage-related lysozyme (muramidase)
MTHSIPRETVFDAIHEWLGRSLNQVEVHRLEMTIDRLMETSTKRPDNSPNNTVPCVPSRRISPAGVDLIKRFEGCASLRSDGLVEAYPDPGTGGDPWTIGWGATGHGWDGEDRIGPGTVWTQEQCDLRLEHDLQRYAAEVEDALEGAPTSQAQFDALVSFHYNTGAIARATLTKRHRARDFSAAAAEFRRWNKAGGRVLRGLTRRRAAEAKLYQSQLAENLTG